MTWKTIEISTPRLVIQTLFTVFWVSAVYGFFCDMMGGVGDSLSHVISLLLDAVISVLGISLLRKRVDIILVASFVIISWISSIHFNGEGYVTWINGFRYYLSFLFIIPVYRYIFATQERREYFISTLNRYIYLFLWVQVPCMLLQFAIFGAGDMVGGSLGAMYSGVISTMIYLSSFYLMVRKWDKSKSYFWNLRKNWILLFLLFPTFLNETKVSFVYVLMYFLLLIPFNRRFFKSVLIALPLVLLTIYGAASLYNASLAEGNENDIHSIEYITDYIWGDEIIQELMLTYVENEIDDQVTPDYARGAKMTVLPIVMADKPWSELWGFGLGQFKGGTTLEKTDFARRFEFLIKGTQMMVMVVLLELGWLGFAWVIFFLFVLYAPAGKGMKTNLQALLFTLGIFMVNYVYSICFNTICFSLTFMLIAMLSRRWQWTFPPSEEGSASEESPSVPLLSQPR